MFVTATPGKDERRILLKELPSVVPKPLSKGSTTNFPYWPSSERTAVSILGFSISILYKPSYDTTKAAS
jgi:hypothetical protein